MKLVRLPIPDPELRIIIYDNCTNHLLRVGDVIYCQACCNYTWFHTTDNKKYMSCDNLSKVREILEPQGFVPIHKSYMVNSMHITGFKGNVKCAVTLSNNVVLSVSRRQRTRFNKLIEEYKESVLPLTQKSIPLIPISVPQDKLKNQSLR